MPSTVVLYRIVTHKELLSMSAKVAYYMIKSKSAVVRQIWNQLLILSIQTEKVA
jgi:hypothetical protein